VTQDLRDDGELVWCAAQIRRSGRAVRAQFGAPTLTTLTAPSTPLRSRSSSARASPSG
jgi:hypothetical protein